MTKEGFVPAFRKSAAKVTSLFETDKCFQVFFSSSPPDRVKTVVLPHPKVQQNYNHTYSFLRQKLLLSQDDAHESCEFAHVYLTVLIHVTLVGNKSITCNTCIRSRNCQYGLVLSACCRSAVCNLITKSNAILTNTICENISNDISFFNFHSIYHTKEQRKQKRVYRS